MMRKQQLEDIADWLNSCVSEAEADGYQNHSSESWSHHAPTISVSDDDIIAIVYDGIQFTAKLSKERKA